VERRERECRHYYYGRGKEGREGDIRESRGEGICRTNGKVLPMRLFSIDIQI